MELTEIRKYTDRVIPNLEKRLGSKETSAHEKVELYSLYVDVLRMISPWDFITFNKYMELDEDHRSPTKAFYHHRRNHMSELFEALNAMEVEDKYDILLISLPPRVGKTTTGIRFLSWIIGKYPEETQLAISYSDNITSSFYIGVMEIVQSKRFKEIFQESNLVSQNAKREEIWLKVAKRYPSITFAPIGGSLTGRCEASKYLYCDDLVSGYEEAVSVTRMEKLWQLYTVNAKQRKKDHCKEIHVATIWSVHDPISRLTQENEENSRCKVINIPCFDENEESNFNFFGGFSTEYYKELERTMESIMFNSLYRGQPVEREGILYQKDELQYYFKIPEARPDTIISICDSKNLGTDFVCAPVGYVYGDFVYVDAVVYNNGLPEITRPAVADLWTAHKVVRADVEMNNGGNYYAEDLEKLLIERGAKTSLRLFYSSNNKKVKIITYSDFVKKYFIFRDPSTYSPSSEYGRFMRALLSWTQLGNNKNDDAPDAVAMLAQLVQDITGSSIKIIDRRTLGL